MQLPARRLLSSRATPYVNVTYDFDTFASLNLPTTVSVRLSMFLHACIIFRASSGEPTNLVPAKLIRFSLHGTGLAGAVTTAAD